jgi:Cu-Zn family superoxide dismutase
MTIMRNTLSIVLALAALGCTHQQLGEPRHHATLAPTQGNKAAGTVELIPVDGAVRLTGTITGLEPNSEHGFHVHEKGDCSAPDASSAGGHFNPTSQVHGNPASPPHHAGDTPNLLADAQGNAQVNATLEGVTVGSGPNDLLGKALVLHAKVDDYKSQPAGNSGSRIACGVIE